MRKNAGLWVKPATKILNRRGTATVQRIRALVAMREVTVQILEASNIAKQVRKADGQSFPDEK